MCRPIAPRNPLRQPFLASMGTKSTRNPEREWRQFLMSRPLRKYGRLSKQLRPTKSLESIPRNGAVSQKLPSSHRLSSKRRAVTTDSPPREQCRLLKLSMRVLTLEGIPRDLLPTCVRTRSVLHLKPFRRFANTSRPHLGPTFFQMAPGRSL